MNTEWTTLVVKSNKAFEHKKLISHLDPPNVADFCPDHVNKDVLACIWTLPDRVKDSCRTEWHRVLAAQPVASVYCRLLHLSWTGCTVWLAEPFDNSIHSQTHQRGCRNELSTSVHGEKAQWWADSAAVDSQSAENAKTYIKQTSSHVS